jgi:hypothetical protein
MSPRNPSTVTCHRNADDGKKSTQTDRHRRHHIDPQAAHALEGAVEHDGLAERAEHHPQEDAEAEQQQGQELIVGRVDPSVQMLRQACDHRNHEKGRKIPREYRPRSREHRSRRNSPAPKRSTGNAARVMTAP